MTALTNLVENAVNYSPDRVAGVGEPRGRRDGHGRDRGHRSGRSASRPSTRSGSSSGSSGSTRPGPGPPAAPGSGWRSSSTSPPTTAARPRCGAGSAPGRPSPWPCRSCPRPPPSGRPVVAEIWRPPTAEATCDAGVRPGPGRARPRRHRDQGVDRRGRGVDGRPAGLPAAPGGIRPRRSPRPVPRRWPNSTATAPTSCCWT